MAAARAEARRKAILSRGSDRLNKLTSSARGDDDVFYKATEKPIASSMHTPSSFLGDDPTPVNPSSLPVKAGDASKSDGLDTGMSSELQQEFIRALMQAGGVDEHFSASDLDSRPSDSSTEDPMSTIMNTLAQLSGQVPASAGAIPDDTPADIFNGPTNSLSQTKLQKLLSAVHLMATWSLLAYFVLVKEPVVRTHSSLASEDISIWRRWAELSWRNDNSVFGVQPVDFFWTFITLQLGLHSIQIFTKTNPLQMPALVAMALPHLPSTLSFIIKNGFSYARMLGSLLDDLAGLIVGLGLLIWCATVVAGSK